MWISHRKEIRKPTVRPTVHTNPSRKWGFLETFYKLEQFENAGFAFKGTVSHYLASL